MSKMILPSLVAALFCVAGSAQAEGISASTLSDMGLSGLTVMSDSDALSVRGHGFKSSKAAWKSKSRRKQPWSAAAGASIATVTDKHGNGSATSQNSYAAEGPYAAGGENFSEASLATTDTETVTIDGVTKSVTNAWTIHVEAGGFSNSWSF